MEALRRHASDSCVPTTILAPARNVLGIPNHYPIEGSRNRLWILYDTRSTGKDGNWPIDTVCSPSPTAAHPAVQAERAEEKKVTWTRRGTSVGLAKSSGAQSRDRNILSAALENTANMLMQ